MNMRHWITGVAGAAGLAAALMFVTPTSAQQMTTPSAAVMYAPGHGRGGTGGTGTCTGTGFVDANGDGVCDNAGTGAGQGGTGAGFVDADGDGVCDNVGTGTGTGGRQGGQGQRGHGRP